MQIKSFKICRSHISTEYSFSGILD